MRPQRITPPFQGGVRRILWPGGRKVYAASLHGAYVRFNSGPGLSQTYLAALRGGLSFQAQISGDVDSLLITICIMLLLQCKDIVRAMPRKISAAATHPLTIVLPVQVVAMIDRLIPIGLYGSSRAEVARTLIQGRLEQILASAILPQEAPTP